MSLTYLRIDYNCRRVYPCQETSGFYLNSGGTPSKQANCSYSNPPIPVTPGETIEWIVTNIKASSANNKRMHGYKNNKVEKNSWVSQIGIITFNANEGPVLKKIRLTIPTNVNYVSLSHNDVELYCKCWVVGIPE